MRTIIFLATFSLPLLTLAGPFGLESGESLASLQKRMTIKKEREYVYSTTLPPRPHTDFGIYHLIVTPQHGLCKISALSKNIRASSSGRAVIDKFDALESALNEKYGKAERNDFLRSGSIWKEDSDWMMALYKEERVLTSFWTSSDSEELPDGVKAIELEASALSTTTAFIALRYEFKDAVDCLALLRKKKNDAL